jgi:hypothetical protein
MELVLAALRAGLQRWIGELDDALKAVSTGAAFVFV